MKKSRNGVVDSTAMFAKIVTEISDLIRVRRYQAVQSVNREQLILYFVSGKILSSKIKDSQWGAAVLEAISLGIQENFPGIRGFSVRNLYNIRDFYREYYNCQFLQSATAEIDKTGFLQLSNEKSKVGKSGKVVTTKNNVTSALKVSTVEVPVDIQTVFFNIGFTHHTLLLQKCSSIDERFFYMQQAAHNQWSVEVLRYHVLAKFYQKKGKLANNFSKTMPSVLTNHALEVFKDEYLLNFVNIEATDGEEVLEYELVKNLRDFLMSLGREFAFLGNQYRVIVDEEEFFVDLLFFHRQLQSLVAIELKTGNFKPEFAGKMNFYLEALDNYVKLKHENPSIGIVLCREKKNTIVEFAFKRLDRPMGVATYITDEKLPPEFRKYLPSAAQLKKAAIKGIKQ